MTELRWAWQTFEQAVTEKEIDAACYRIKMAEAMLEDEVLKAKLQKKEADERGRNRKEITNRNIRHFISMLLGKLT